MDRSEIESKFSKRIDTLVLKDYDITVRTRPLNGLQRARFIERSAERANCQDDSKKLVEITADLAYYVVACGLVDESGVRYYGDDELEIIAQKYPCDAINEISEHILSMSKLLRKDVIEAEKNSEPTPSVSSS